MVDIHSHILPGLDDGARSLDLSLEMLRIAAGAGTTDIVATPHANSRYRFRPGIVHDLLAELTQHAPASLRLHSGCDFHLAHDNIVDALQHPSRYTINHLNYLLIELSDLVIFHNTAELFARLEGAGMRLILTHPERNPLLRLRPELIQAWVAQGRTMQLTAQSLTGAFGDSARRFALWMLDTGLAHFVASDAHDPLSRPPLLDEAHQLVQQRYGPDLARLLFVDHPTAVLAGDPLDLSSFPPALPPKPSGWKARLFGK
jgi:protein-tyrosine phosphatase